MQSKTEQLDELRSLQNLGRSLPAAYFGLLENKLSYTESFHILHCTLSHLLCGQILIHCPSQPSEYRLTIYRYAIIVSFSKYR